LKLCFQLLSETAELGEMIKERFIHWVLRPSLVVLLFVVLGFGFELGAATRTPNILFILADDYRPDALRALGNRVVKTPNLDSLVERGMSFSCCYVMGSMSGAVCQPSRTMLLTGRSWLRIPKPKDDIPNSMPKLLKTAGYETFHVGKGGNEYTAGLEAFETNLLMNDPTPELRRGSSERHADAAIKFLRERKADKPFYLYFAPPVPHDPRVAAPEFHQMYSASKIPLPAAFMPMHPFDNGEMTVRDEKLAPWPRTPEDTKQQIADYYACITGLDHHVGRVFAELKAQGQWEHTVIVFAGDNGLSLGEHGLFGKQNLYEFGGMHVPCVVAGPGIRKGRSEALMYLMDLFPTFCDFAGVQIPKEVEGKSIVPILRTKRGKVRDVLYTGYRSCQRAIRDDRWKLIRYPLVNKTQLFDLNADPHELKNLAEEPAYASRTAEMMELLRKEMERYGDSCTLTVEHPADPAWSPEKAVTK
jgi:arylsulfatase A-like enzyme